MTKAMRSFEYPCDRPWTLYWIANFKRDKEFGHMRFKRLNIGYPPFDFYKELIDSVELDEFAKIEDTRLPLFIGSSFGYYPSKNQIPNFFNGEKYVAILGKSLLNGCVYGLYIYKLHEGMSYLTDSTREKVKCFSNVNDSGIDQTNDVLAYTIIKSSEQLVGSVIPGIKEKVKKELTELVIGNSQVTVICSFKSDSEFDRIRIWKTTFLNANKSSHKSKLLYTENIALYPDWTIVPTGTTVKFVLVFSGLPNNCKSFDLIEEIPEPDGFEVRNIKRNKKDVYHIHIQ